MLSGGSGARVQMFKHQADTVKTQANPVSGTKYTVLDTTNNVRIESIAVNVTWATTQPTPLEIHLTIDGQSYTASQTDPVSATNYIVTKTSAAAGFSMTTTDNVDTRAFLIEARSIKIETEITWATTQPTPLVVRVKYAKIT